MSSRTLNPRTTAIRQSMPIPSPLPVRMLPVAPLRTRAAAVGEQEAGASIVEEGGLEGPRQAAQEEAASPGRQREQLHEEAGHTLKPRMELHFVMDETEDGRRLKMTPIVDEYSGEYLTMEVEARSPPRTW